MLVINEFYTTVISIIIFVAIVFLNIYLLSDKRKINENRKSKLSLWFDKIFSIASEYYCLDIKREGKLYKLSVLYDEFGTKNKDVYILKTDKQYEDICADIIKELHTYIKKGDNYENLYQALKIEMSFEEEIFNIKEDEKWKEQAAF